MSYTSLYIHIPFCPYICDYCAFYTIEKANSTIRRSYLQRLDEELRQQSELCSPLQSIYLGGGTPTFFSLIELEKLMAMVNDYYSRAPGCEFSIECNPDSLTQAKVRVLLDGGVNRFSLGIQSFSMKTRQIIGRPGSVSRVHQTIKLLFALGVKNFNCDLIYGVPGQTLDEWEKDLQRIVEFCPTHISTYALMIEDNTPLSFHGIKEGEETIVVAMWKFANDYLGDKLGLFRYEISNLSRPGFECKHNYSTWMGAPFLGAGPSACYFDGMSRWTNPDNLTQWLQGTPPVEDHVSPKVRAVEILITGLRTTRGWNRYYFKNITGFDFFELRESKLKEFIDSGHISYTKETLRLTNKGLLLADYIGRELL